LIHVATVHWGTDRWIDAQLRYLDRFLPAPFRIYAFLNNVPPGHESKFFYSSDEPIKQHAVKLNVLAEFIRASADRPSDVLIFIDGDAFPTARLQPLIDDRLERHSLIAVQRYENLGDLQPHPCFCMTTVGFWHEIGGDWKPGHTWLDVSGKRLTDVGGNLLGLLDRAGVDWYRLRRVNIHNPHPILFGFYGDEEHGAVVYHHGAGFRGAPERIARLGGGEPRLEVTVRAKAIDHLRKYSASASELLLRLHPVTRMERRLAEQEQRLAEPVFSQIEQDEAFWRAFLSQGSA
jgi:hypothetical protein